MLDCRETLSGGDGRIGLKDFKVQNNDDKIYEDYFVVNLKSEPRFGFGYDEIRLIFVGTHRTKHFHLINTNIKFISLILLLRLFTQLYRNIIV